jgi:hypothetical protein
MIRRRIQRIARLFKKPQYSVIDARLYKAIRLCLKASDMGLVNNLTHKESIAFMDHAIAELDQRQQPQRVYRAEAGA